MSSMWVLRSWCRLPFGCVVVVLMVGLGGCRSEIPAPRRTSPILSSEAMSGVRIAGESRLTIRRPLPMRSGVTVALPNDPALFFGYGITRRDLRRVSRPVRFEIVATKADGESLVVFEDTVGLDKAVRCGTKASSVENVTNPRAMPMVNR